MSANRVDVGTPPERFEGWTTTNVCFHGFAELPTARDEGVISPKFSCFGHKWRLDIYPGGRANSSEGYVAVQLNNCSNKSIKIEWGCSVRDVDDKEVVCCQKESNKFDALSSTPGSAWNAPNFAKLSTLMELLVQGSLVIEVRMKLPTTGNNATQFIPTNPIYKNVLKLCNEEETADVIFEVGGQHQAGTNTPKNSTTTTMFHAHRLILKNNTSALYEMCGKSDGGITTVSITDVTPKIFGLMLLYAYGGKLSDEDLKNNAKDIINACDKYGVVHLKLEAEASYVKSNEITVDNMIDNLLYADSKNLALLKEAVMDFIIKNKHSVMSKVSFINVPGDMIKDVLAAMARGETNDDGEEEDDESIKYNRMSVGTLRKMLDEKGLDVDGSREAMIARLKEHST